MSYDTMFTIDGLQFQYFTDQSDETDAPWVREDGHGDVRVVHNVRYMEQLQKRPGERVMYHDRYTYWLYDFAGAMKKAKADGWGTSNATSDMLPGKVRELAVTEDMQRLSNYLAGEWYYVDVAVKLLDIHGRPVEGYDDSMGSIESFATDYIEEEAHRMAEDIAKGLQGQTSITKTILIR
jgi:hypothetical protein